MKKFVITSFALLVFAGSTLFANAAAKPKPASPSQPAQTDVIPCCDPSTPAKCDPFKN